MPTDTKISSALTRLAASTFKLGGLLGARMDANEHRLLAVDETALLAPFRRSHAELVFDGAWAGEHLGKFLDAACIHLGFRVHEALREKVARCAAALIGAQAADGYLGAYRLEQRWSSWDVWVHKYGLIGLMSYHRLTGCEAALGAVVRAGDLLAGVFGDAPRQKNISAVGMHMGLASTSVLEPMCALYDLTSEPRYLEFCRYIVRSYEGGGASRLVSALLDHGEVHRTANGKAYEMLSNLVGLVDLHQLTGDSNVLRAVTNAWRDIVDHQLYPTGTVSAGEHFQQPGQLAYHHASNVGETCATVSWLQLNHRLLQLTGEARYGGEIERTVFNHLLAAQDPADGRFCYYTGLAGEKEFSSALLCCVSSGPRAIAALPDLVWARNESAIVLNILCAGAVSFPHKGAFVTLSIETNYPHTGDATLRIHSDAATGLRMRIRVPIGAHGLTARWSGKQQTAEDGEWLELNEEWAGDVVIDLSVQMATGAIAVQGAPERLMLFRGPQVLAFDCACNPDVASRHRIAIEEGTARSCDLVPGSNAAELNGLKGVVTHDGRYAYEPARLRLIPFSEARTYSASLPTRQNRDPLPLSAYERSAASHERPSDTREALTDECKTSFRALRSGVPSVAALVGFEDKDMGRVWFAVRTRPPHLVSRIIFRQGPIGADGGWFDTQERKPTIEIAMHPLDAFYSFLSDFYRAEWTTLAALDAYPDAAAANEGALKVGQEYEVRLASPVLAYAVRVIGAPARETVRCAGLAAYAPPPN